MSDQRTEHTSLTPSDCLPATAWRLLAQGHSLATVAEQLGVTPRAVARCVQAVATAASPELSTAARRLLESLQLDAAQAAIWPSVLAGDLEAIDRFLKISDRRVKLLRLTQPDTTAQTWTVRVQYAEPSETGVE